jgi:hypothetical protein
MSTSYHTRLQKGGALLDDMRLLVRAWNEDANADPVGIVRNLLGKKTQARSNDTFVRAFSPRFLNGDPPSAWKIVRCLEDRNAEIEVIRPVYYWITARNDRLLYDYVTQELIQIARSGDGSARIEETKAWVHKRLQKTGQEWTPTVTTKVARGVLAALRDFAILEGSAKKRVASVHLPVESFCFLAFCLMQLGFGGESLVAHHDWRLFLLTSSLVERLFLEAHQLGFLSFHSAGRIYRIEFAADNYEEYTDVLFGRKS